MAHSDRKTRPTLLLCAKDKDFAAVSQGAIFNTAGYPVILASAPDIDHHLRSTAFDVAVLNHTLPFAARKRLAREIKAIHRGLGVLILHASGVLGNPHADIAVDSRLGPAAILRALKRVEMMQWMGRTHAGAEDECLVVVDENRNYVFASDAACRLLGYDRVQFLELRIDDVVAGASSVAQPLFDRFVRDREQQGSIVLRHRSGRLIPVHYDAEVVPDGSLLARWTLMEDASASPVEPELDQGIKS
ncbi:MAG: PAS domain-containing protein [Actinomycetota bacterium]